MKKQLTLFDTWIDGRFLLPPDGERVLAYTLIDNPDELLSCFKGGLVHLHGMTLSGPRVRRYQKKFVDEGLHRKIAFWQKIDPLPGEVVCAE